MNFKILLLSSALLSFVDLVVAAVVWFMFVCYFLGCMYIYFNVRHDHVKRGVLTVVGQTMG